MALLKRCSQHQEKAKDLDFFSAALSALGRELAQKGEWRAKDMDPTRWWRGGGSSKSQPIGGRKETDQACLVFRSRDGREKKAAPRRWA